MTSRFVTKYFCAILAFFTIGLALMTFVQTIFPLRLTPRKARIITAAYIFVVFLFLILIISIPSSTLPRYYGDTGYVATNKLNGFRLV